ncbi:MAG: nucleotide exchange factor GrpE [Clostridia bacterium]|nr:nucleotide exchange factor GrpE [Clostridia bacterium]MDD4047922.1 nucleotide exchange factor GrpE [Clostridia bacterium]
MRKKEMKEKEREEVCSNQELEEQVNMNNEESEKESIHTKEQGDNNKKEVKEASDVKNDEKDILLAQKEKELNEAKEGILRVRADFDNYRKRMNKEKEEIYRYASMGLMENLLPVLDNIGRAMESLEQENEETKKIFLGMKMIQKQLIETLEKEGLKTIEAVEKTFDPLFHDAMMQVPVEEGVEDNQIVEELRKGYCFKDKVLRASMVKVAKNS